MALSFLAASAPTCECCRRWHGCRAARPEDCEIVVNRGLVPDQVDGCMVATMDALPRMAEARFGATVQRKLIAAS